MSDIVSSLPLLDGVRTPSGGGERLSAARCLRRAREARVIAKLSADAAFGRLLLDIADAYEDLADDQRRRSALAR